MGLLLDRALLSSLSQKIAFNSDVGTEEEEDVPSCITVSPDPAPEAGINAEFDLADDDDP